MSSDGKLLKEIQHQMLATEATRLSPLATLSRKAVRQKDEPRLAEDYRTGFSLDVDRILHSLAYTRYIDKTQVFSLVQNDHITHRVLHVQLVSKIARTIGRYLGLNEDLIEAIALGHDLGHPPFGHAGEKVLSRLCVENGIGAFCHNVQSVQFLEEVEKKGVGWNLTLQTLDGIFCHDGEVHHQTLQPQKGKSFEAFFEQMECQKNVSPKTPQPMTLEGCVMRFADTIGYIGRDMEDAIRLGLITRDDLPEEATADLGNTNGTIVYRLVSDVIENSHGRLHIGFSTAIAEALLALKRFNYQRIYYHPKLKKNARIIETLFEKLFHRFLDDLRMSNLDSPIFRHFLAGMSAQYREGHQPAEMVRDFISGMTDHYFLDQCPADMRPQPIA